MIRYQYYNFFHPFPTSDEEAQRLNSALSQIGARGFRLVSTAVDSPTKVLIYVFEYPYQVSPAEPHLVAPLATTPVDAGTGELAAQPPSAWAKKGRPKRSSRA